jgi:hypothetical protein
MSFDSDAGHGSQLSSGLQRLLPSQFCRDVLAGLKHIEPALPYLFFLCGQAPASVWKNPDYHGICPPPAFTNPNPSNNQYCGGQGYTQYCPPGTPTNCWCPGNIKFAAMVHTQPSTNYSTVISNSKTAKYGAVYATDATLPNPYSAISTYFSGEMLLL